MAHCDGRQLAIALLGLLLLSAVTQTIEQKPSKNSQLNPQLEILQPDDAINRVAVLVNNGQEKPGPCQLTRPAPGYSSIAQFEGLWFRRYRSRLSPNEPTLKCATSRYLYKGNRTLTRMFAKQFTKTNDWQLGNETNLLDVDDQSTWVNVQSNFRKRLLFLDQTLGVSIIYACLSAPTGTHRNIASLYTRSPTTNLSLAYLNTTFDIFRRNGIYDVLPLLHVNHENCSGPNYPKMSTTQTPNVSLNKTESGPSRSIVTPAQAQAQSKMVFNNGQEKEGQCQPTRPPANYSSIAQFEGLWFVRYQTRSRPREPLLKCAYNRYEYRGNFTLASMISKQSSANSQWTHPNESHLLSSNDTSLWTTPQSTTSTRVIYLDPNLGVSLLYRCTTTPNGHRNSASVLSRHPATPLSAEYLETLWAIFTANGVNDILPLHPVDQNSCSNEHMPIASYGPDGKKLGSMATSTSGSCNCTCAKVEL